MRRSAARPLATDWFRDRQIGRSAAEMGCFVPQSADAMRQMWTVNLLTINPNAGVDAMHPNVMPAHRARLRWLDCLTASSGAEATMAAT